MFGTNYDVLLNTYIRGRVRFKDWLRGKERVNIVFTDLFAENNYSWNYM